MSQTPRLPCDMKFVRHVSPAHFLETAEAWLGQAEAEHGLLLGLAHSRVASGTEPDASELFATVQQGDRVEGCVFRTPPHPLGLTRIPESAIPLILRQVAPVYPSLPGVVGPPESARAFADAWSRATGASIRKGPEMEIQVLRVLTPPSDPPDGRMRLAAAGDAGLLEEWGLRFVAEAGVGGGGGVSPSRGLMAADSLFVWEHDGQVVSMVAAVGPTPRGIRLAYAYTPPESRGRGYATVLVSELSRLQLDRGFDFCFLYTDRANPTSCAIYRRLGYRPVSMALMLDFEPTRG